MEIDSFYQDNDMSFGMDGRITFANDFINATGKSKASSPSRLDQVAEWYPMSDDCTALENTLASLDSEMATNAQKLGNPKTKRAEKRVLNDYQNSLNKRKLQLEDKYRTMGCKVQKQQAQDTAFLSQLGATVGGAVQSGDMGKKQPNYVLYIGVGLGVLALVGTIVYVVKKK